ncbi:integrase catalytic domain-containing protein [Trichonephila clavipes]|nr:integrase catalytic domain-containing protein [Trichonephila clavipes]
MEVSYLSAGKQLPSTNKLIPLTPFYDDAGIIRVGGRLKNSILADSQKHPILLPKTDHVVNLIISDYHLKLLHAGPQLLQAAPREKFWILSARDAVRRVVRRCISCFRNLPKFTEQIMGDLPESRVYPSSVFQRTGIDFASPFLIRSSKGRGSRNTKCYICVFVCLPTKAVHLEVVSDLTSKAFIACLKRFVARRGKPSEIFCDQGTNFYGASRDLRKEFLQLMKEDAVHQFLVTDNITFHFNPPSAPHFGGIWEATVKSFKFHLNRVVGVTSLTFEELSTLSSQIEACLNSRLLCVLSSSLDDPCVLTPGHFLIGKALTAIPQPTVPDDLRHCDRWRLLTRMTQHFWNRWSSEYLTMLQSRSKWRIVQKNLDIGDLVLIKHDNSPPLQWKLGKVTETFPGKDVRFVWLRSKLKWNDLLPAEEYREWQQFLVSLENIKNIEIPRRILVAFPEVIEIHDFADASERCYGAAVYCKSKNLKSETLVRLITSKSRVAPIKSLTIPRLELCAAVLLAKLVKRVVAALQLETAELYLWSDSMIILAWLRKEPMDLKTFVQNRVAKIQQLYPNQLWRHVPSD